MNPRRRFSHAGSTRIWGFAAIGAAFSASACCTLPLLPALIGAGAGIGSQLDVIAPFQMPLSAVSVGALGFAFWKGGRAAPEPAAGNAEAGGGDCACDEPGRPRGRMFLWGSAVVVAALLIGPSLVGLVPVRTSGVIAGVIADDEQEVLIRVGGMTCISCATGLEATLRRADGVLAATVTMEPPVARISYDDRRTSPATLVATIEAAGYTATIAGAAGTPGTADTGASATAALPVGETCNVHGHNHALDTAGAEPMAPITTAALRDAFNRSSADVRLVALLSPACPECVHGHEIVRGIMDRNQQDGLKGLVVWLPMVEGDSPEAATARAAGLTDDRLVVQGWDGPRHTGAAFQRALGLSVPAWDVYLVYAPGVRWEGDAPPTPTFWMHQLTADTGADQRYCLDAAALEREVARLIPG